MAISTDIEILERKWQENPTGLLFAPLAEAHRKAGQWERALEILEAGLAKHADYVPALIVRGRCQLDAEDLAGAEATFVHALERDPVNPIALRGIAEVLERTGRRQDAIARLEFLLEVDRGDSDARAALARLLEPPPAAPDADPEVREAPDPVAEWAPSPVMEIEPASVDPEPLAEPRMDIVPEDDRNLPVAAESQAPVWQSWSTWEQWGVVAGATAETEQAAGEPEEPVAEAPVAEVPVAEPPVAEVPEAEEPAIEEPAVEEPATEEPVAEAPVEDPVVEWAEPVPEVEPEPGVPEPDLLPFSSMPHETVEETELVITESMAELFLRQGHHDLALAVYRQLVVRGDHPHLEETVARMEADRAPEPAPEERSTEPEPAEVEPTPAPSRAAAVTGGERVDAFLRKVLDAPPPAGASQVLPPAIERGPKGAPTRPGEQPLTLAAVFGGGGGDEPAAPSPVAGAAMPERQSPAEVSAPEPSYDEFFAVPPSAAQPSSREPESAQAAGAGGRADVEDLKQFNDWLRGLQR